MKTILVTGGYGFIGSCFVLQEIAAGHRVINLDKMTYAAERANLAAVEKHVNYKFYEGDIADAALAAHILKEEKIDWLVNFAAESHVDNSIASPDSFMHTNITGVFNLLQQSIKIQNPEFRFLQVSTDEVFGSLGKTGKFSEASPYNPSSPYSASKAAADHLARAWHVTYGLPAIITNCTNNYGPRQNREKLIPKIIANALAEKPIPIYGKGENIRDWIFVEDHCRGIKLALEKGTPGEAYCFGGNAEKTNNEVVETICRELDLIKPRQNGKSYIQLVTYVIDRLGHDLRYAIDDGKAQKELGYWRDKDFATGIKKTISWYYENNR